MVHAAVAWSQTWPRSIGSAVSADRFADVLAAEFSGEEGTFLTRLRCELIWDRDAFVRLERAMRAACRHYEQHDQLPRPLADGFYFASTFVASWTSHPNFPHPAEPYYAACIQRLDDLAWWFFVGRSPRTDEYDWETLDA
jgi:hypothetical protein